MCGAFSIRLNPYALEFLDKEDPAHGWKPVYNARPGMMLPIVTEEAPKKITTALWTFLPHWMNDAKGKGVINAKAETARVKPYFRTAFQRHRCVIPADGFFEWQKAGKFKIPYYFFRKDKKPFLFAGLYDELPDATSNLGFAILTTTPNALVKRVHIRMPVMLMDDVIPRWLDSETTPAEAETFLRSYPETLMTMHEVSRDVNSPRNNSPDILMRAGD